MTALLDFLCCGLGAATVLLMISVTLPEEHPRAGSVSLVVRSVRATDSPSAEVGIEYRSPNSDVWQSVPNHPSIRFSALSDSPSGGQAVLVLMDPEPGDWQFRPYLRDFPNASPAAAMTKPVSVSLRFFGSSHDTSENQTPTEMILPGDSGQTVEIRIMKDDNQDD